MTRIYVLLLGLVFLGMQAQVSLAVSEQAGLRSEQAQARPRTWKTVEELSEAELLE